MPFLRTEGSVTVLNGEAKVGDLVAYAVCDGSTASLAIGEVIGFEDRSGGYHAPGTKVTRLKVRLTDCTGWSPVKGDIAGIEILDRVAIIGQEPLAPCRSEAAPNDAGARRAGGGWDRG